MCAKKLLLLFVCAGHSWKRNPFRNSISPVSFSKIRHLFANSFLVAKLARTSHYMMSYNSNRVIGENSVKKHNSCTLFTGIAFSIRVFISLGTHVSSICARLRRNYLNLSTSGRLEVKSSSRRGCRQCCIAMALKLLRSKRWHHYHIRSNLMWSARCYPKTQSSSVTRDSIISRINIEY